MAYQTTIVTAIITNILGIIKQSDVIHLWISFFCHTKYKRHPIEFCIYIYFVQCVYCKYVNGGYYQENMNEQHHHVIREFGTKFSSNKIYM